MNVRFSRYSPAYTLLELLVVLAIVALVASLGLSAFGVESSTRLQVKSTASEIVTQLRNCHADAIKNHRAVYLRFDSGGTSWHRDPDDPHTLPAGIIAAVSGIASAPSASSTVDIGFFPNGGSTGGKIVLNSNSESAIITVDWLTGNIRWTRS